MSEDKDYDMIIGNMNEIKKIKKRLSALENHDIFRIWSSLRGGGKTTLNAILSLDTRVKNNEEKLKELETKFFTLEHNREIEKESRKKMRNAIHKKLKEVEQKLENIDNTQCSIIENFKDFEERFEKLGSSSRQTEEPIPLEPELKERIMKLKLEPMKKKNTKKINIKEFVEELHKEQASPEDNPIPLDEDDEPLGWCRNCQWIANNARKVRKQDKEELIAEIIQDINEIKLEVIKSLYDEQEKTFAISKINEKLVRWEAREMSLLLEVLGKYFKENRKSEIMRVFGEWLLLENKRLIKRKEVSEEK